MTSLLFMLALVPVLLVMLGVTLEFSHLVGVRDDLRGVVDEQGYEALAYHRAAGEVETNLRRKLADQSRVSFSMVNVGDVAATVTRGAARVSASLDYRGTFLSFLENFLGRESPVLELSTSASARRQRGGVLLVLDRAVAAAIDPCAAPEFEARATFIDGVVDAVQTNSENLVQVGVFPGVVEAVDLLTLDGSDGIDRCRQIREGAVYDTSGIVARVGAAVDPFDVAGDLARHAAIELLGRQLEYRAVVLVIGADSYPRGYSAFAQQALSAVAEAAELPLQVFIVVAGVDGTFMPLPPAHGAYGGVFREVGATLAELQRGRLASAVSRAMTERIVWER